MWIWLILLLINTWALCSNSWWFPVHMILCRSWRKVWNSFINASQCCVFQRAFRHPHLALKKERLLFHYQSITNANVIFFNMSISEKENIKQVPINWLYLEDVFHKLSFFCEKVRKFVLEWKNIFRDFYLHNIFASPFCPSFTSPHFTGFSAKTHF